MGWVGLPDFEFLASDWARLSAPKTPLIPSPGYP